MKVSHPVHGHIFIALYELLIEIFMSDLLYMHLLLSYVATSVSDPLCDMHVVHLNAVLVTDSSSLFSGYSEAQCPGANSSQPGQVHRRP